MTQSHPKFCLQCNCAINNQNIFCSKSCAAKTNNKNRKPRSEESKLKSSISVKKFYINKTQPIPPGRNGSCNYPPKPTQCKVCGKNHIRHNAKTCSYECQIILQSTQQSLRLSNPEYRRIHNYGRGKKSWLESSFSDWLISKNILNFKTEEKFHNPQLDKFYFVDFLFEEKKLIIELDGTQHRKTVSQDKIRDEYLQSLGYTVIRITHDEYRKKSRIAEIELLVQSN